MALPPSFVGGMPAFSFGALVAAVASDSVTPATEAPTAPTAPVPAPVPAPAPTLRLALEGPDTAPIVPSPNGKIRLHMPAIPHTITTEEFSHCAFTGKVLRFAPMMHTVRRADGTCPYEVYHYGVEGSESGADVQVQLMRRDEWNALREQAFHAAYPTADVRTLYDPATFVGDLAAVDNVLYRVFNDRLRVELAKHYRGRGTDLVCLPLGHAHRAAVDALDVCAIESGIGYPAPYLPFRVYESFAWYHHTAGKEGTHGKNYSFVAPNYFDTAAWPLAAPPYTAPRPRVGFLGRICNIKGMEIIVEVARRCPEYDFVLCGQGDPAPYLAHGLHNLFATPPLQGRARATYLGGLHAFFMPSVFIEPFAGAAVEAQLCGTPVVAPSYGAFTETVEQGKTGLLCHTLGEFCAAVRAVVTDAATHRGGGTFNRAYIRDRAVRLYGLDAVGATYDKIFQHMIQVSGGLGWYSSASFLDFSHAY